MKMLIKKKNASTFISSFTSAVAILLILILRGNFASTAETSPWSKKLLSALRHPSKRRTRSSFNPMCEVC